MLASYYHTSKKSCLPIYIEDRLDDVPRLETPPDLAWRRAAGKVSDHGKHRRSLQGEETYGSCPRIRRPRRARRWQGLRATREEQKGKEISTSNQKEVNVTVPHHKAARSSRPTCSPLSA